MNFKKNLLQTLFLSLPLALFINEPEKDNLQWHDFPTHNNYTIEQQIYYSNKYPLGFGENGTILNDENKISEKNLKYLIKLAEKKLSYNKLDEKNGEELFLIVSHLTQTILKPCIESEKSYETIKNISYKRNNDIIEEYKKRKKEQPALCINYTIMSMEIFNGFKKKYPSLDRYEFIPITSTIHNHAMQGFYDKENNKIAIICNLTDDKDSGFNSGKYKLNWEGEKPEFFHKNYIDFIKIAYNSEINPKKTIKILEEMKENKEYFDLDINYYLSKSYNLLGDNKKSNYYLKEILDSNTPFAFYVFQSRFNL
jgi:hypothetical protein